MAKYRVLVIAHSLKNNIVGKFNDVIDETQLTSNPTELVQAGFIELVDVEDLDVVEEEVLVEAKKPKAKK